jgi:hypothetical protein
MTQLTQWHRDVAAKFADAFPMTRATPIRASGNSLAAENDEGEPKYIRTPELDSRNNAYNQNFGNGNANINNKSWAGWRARPVRRFPIG